ncbi:hypothetical protein PMI01_02194 [Caulobacter sp. AP07]|uniref:hypothetical protein n=1 Tax=Caulobacter sp. AP07 TaxID=1144304 RepID=UPI0002722021|nr:hypothetical protein [Caulobacter sp. AP07]EJL33232.1 hypothetical protein PMI01_02194 [Caulobacter sp. AP07]
MTRDYRTLDAIVVCACLLMLGGAGLALVYVTIPQANLPIFAALVSGTVGGALGLYTGARWGNKKPSSEDPAASPPSVAASPVPAVEEAKP